MGDFNLTSILTLFIGLILGGGVIYLIINLTGAGAGKKAEKIINDAKKILNPHGFIAFEIGINQANEISKMLEQKFKDIKVEKDVSGIERVIIAQLKL